MYILFEKVCQDLSILKKDIVIFVVIDFLPFDRI